jgi:hypothetical protein
VFFSGKLVVSDVYALVALQLPDMLHPHLHPAADSSHRELIDLSIRITRTGTALPRLLTSIAKMAPCCIVCFPVAMETGAAAENVAKPCQPGLET